MDKIHKIGCMANISCLVIHPDGKCPGPYGKCTCDTLSGNNSQIIMPNKEEKKCGCESVSEGVITTENCPLHYVSPTKPDTEWEKEYRERFVHSIVNPEEEIEFIRSEKEKSYKEGLHKGYEEESVKCWEHGEEYKEIGRQSALSEIMREVEYYCVENVKLWEKSAKAAPSVEDKMYCEGSIGTLLNAKKDLLDKIKDRLNNNK